MPIDFQEESPKIDFQIDFVPDAPKQKRTREQVAASIPPSPDAEMPWYLKVLASDPVQGMAQGAARPDLAIGEAFKGVGSVVSGGLNAGLNVSSQVQGQPQYGTNGVFSGPFQAGKPVLNIPSAHDPSVAPVDRALLQVLEGLTTPESVATLPLAGGQSALARGSRAAFLTQTSSGVGQSAATALDASQTPGTRQEAATHALVNALMSAGLAKSLVGEPTVGAPLTREEVMTQPLPSDVLEALGESPIRKQLPAPGERPTIPIGENTGPLARPAGAARFVNDPSGRSVDLSQLTPKEQIEALRGPKQFVPREEYVKESTGETPIIGEQQRTLPVRLLDPQGKPFEINIGEEIARQLQGVEFKRPVEESGGKVSFAAQAEAKGIPNTRQQAQEGVGAAEQPLDLVEQVKGIVNNNDRLALEQERAKLSSPETQAPGVGTRSQANDALRIIDARLEEIKTGVANKENAALRRILQGKTQEEVPFKKEPLPPTEVKVSPVNQKAISENTQGGKLYGGAFFFDPEFWRGKKSESKGVVGGMQKFKTQAEETADATTPRGVGKLPQFTTPESTPLVGKQTIGLGRLLDPRSVAETPVDKALLTHQYLVQKGRSMTALWAESRRRLGRPFESDKEGKVTLADGSKGYMNDVIEAEMRSPGSQKLTEGQRAFVQWWKGQLRATQQWMREEGVKTLFDDNGQPIKIPENDAYFPRAVIGKEGVGEAPLQMGGKNVGTKQFFQKGRVFASEAEGAANRIKYEPDPYNRVARWMNAVYRSVADQRLANDPALGGVEGGVSYLERGPVVNHPAFRGKIFDQATIDRINKHFHAQTVDPTLRKLGAVSDFVKSARFTADVSAPLNQGLALMGSNPVRWAKATLDSYKAFLNPNKLSEYLSKPENLKAAQEFVDSGGGVAYLYDFLQGAEHGKAITKVPVFGKVVEASGRSMSTFLSIAKIELYKSWLPLAKEKGWSKSELVEAVENSIFSGKMEGIGVSPSRAMVERFFLNAPSYYRAGVNLLAMAGQSGASGAVARRALLGLATATLMSTVAIYTAMRQEGLMSEDEMKERLNPTSSKFLRVPFDVGRSKMRSEEKLKGEYKPDELTRRELNDRVEISHGNFVLSAARLLGKSIGEDSSERGNALRSFIKYRTAPWMNTVAELGTGTDTRGEPVPWYRSVAKSITPLAIEAASSKGGWRQNATEGVTSFVGLNSYPESQTSKRKRVTDVAAKEMFNKESFSQLTPRERILVNDVVEKRMEQDVKQPMTSMQTKFALDNVEKTAKRLHEGLSEKLRATLDEEGLKLAGYKYSMEKGKKTIRLDGEQERNRFDEIAHGLFNKQLSNVVSSSMWEKGNLQTKERILQKVHEAVMRNAWGKMLQELNVEPSDRGERTR